MNLAKDFSGYVRAGKFRNTLVPKSSLTVFARTTLVPKSSLRRSSQGTWDYDLDELNEFYEENSRIEQMGL